LSSAEVALAISLHHTCVLGISVRQAVGLMASLIAALSVALSVALSASLIA
jgi:hypothetical protein